jgi:hypothetical protein
MDKLLPKTERNWLEPGCKVQMKTGEILTVKSLEFTEFVPVERAEYVKKRDIHTVIGSAR